MRLTAVYMLSLAITSASICGCVATGDVQENLDATLWVQTSSEFRAASIGAYSVAASSLQRIIAERPTDEPRIAVVMDIDETVLDSYSYMAQLLLDDEVYTVGSWDQFLAMRENTAVTGAIDFINTGQELGVSFFFITNRECLRRADSSDYCPQKEDTLAVLRENGVKTDLDHVFLRGERVPERCLSVLTDVESEKGSWVSSDKTSRRQCVELDHDIVMLFGDQLGDFVGGLEGATPENRKDLVWQYREKWGSTWFMIPNPTYGGWLDILQPDKRSHLRGW